MDPHAAAILADIALLARVALSGAVDLIFETAENVAHRIVGDPDRLRHQKVKAGVYDLILMDIQMPVLDGHSATRIIRQWELDRHALPLPILALTAHALHCEVEKSRQAGCTAHLTKPIQRSALLAALATHIREPRSDSTIVTPPEGFEQLSRDYLARRREGLAGLRRSVEDGDYDRVRRVAHDIKGTGTSYGFPPLSGAARALEQAAMARDLGNMEHALRSMETYLRTVELDPH